MAKEVHPANESTFAEIEEVRQAHKIEHPLWDVGRHKMTLHNFHQQMLSKRVRWLRYILPPILVVIVAIYQLGVAQSLEATYGHPVHYGVEIAFYSLTGPIVTWWMLVWVEHKLVYQERLEQQILSAEREKASVLSEERARIARDLHDGVAQTLYFLALKTDLLRKQLAGNKTAVKELSAIGKSTRQIIRDIRHTIYALQPLDWSEIGFKKGLEFFIKGFAEQTGQKAVIKIEPALTISPRLEPTIFRLIQESLNNVAKHSHATEILVTLITVQQEQVQLTIQDNGCGFDPLEKDSRGFGIKQMKARVTAVNGAFNIISKPEEGTCVIVQLPTREATND